MRSGTFDYEIVAPATVAQAMALLSDMARLPELHPLIVSVTAVAPEPGALESYRITDRLRWGPIVFPITYEADVLSRTEDAVVTVARQRPATTVENRTRVSPDGSGVRIVVSMTLSAPTLLFGYAFRQAQSAHHELGRRIGRALGASA